MSGTLRPRPARSSVQHALVALNGGAGGGEPPKRKRRPKPEVCKRITAERLRLYKEFERTHPKRKGGNRYSQENVAKRVPVTVKTYRTWEMGEVEPSFPRLRQLAKALDLPETHFLPDPAQVAFTYDEERLAGLVLTRLRADFAVLTKELAALAERLEALERGRRRR